MRRQLSVTRELPAAEADLRLPHAGWSRRWSCIPFTRTRSRTPTTGGPVAGWCDYGELFGAAIQFGNVVATQFHPEKSHAASLRFLANIVVSVDHVAGPTGR